MKIKNLRYKLSAIGFAFVLSLTGCSNQNYNDEQLEQAIESLEESEENIEELKEKDKILTNSEIEYIVDEIDNSSVLSAFYFEESDELVLRCDSESEYYYISGEVYEKINLLLNQFTVKSLILENTNFDLAKLDISNLERVELFNIELDNSKELIKTATKNNVKMDYTMYNDMKSKLDAVNFIADNDIVCNSLTLNIDEEDQLAEYYELFEKINSDRIHLLIQPGNIDPIEIANISTKLNDNTSVFSLDFSYMNSERTFNDRELGIIEIESNNSELCVALNNVIITENTKFLISNNNCSIYLYGTHTEVSPFYDLENVYLVNYYDTNTSINVNFRDNGISTYDEAIDKLKEAAGKKLVK